MDDDHAEDACRPNGEKKKPLVVSGFEFVLMGNKGALNKKGISQIRAHTTRELHRTRRENGQVCCYLMQEHALDPSLIPGCLANA